MSEALVIVKGNVAEIVGARGLVQSLTVRSNSSLVQNVVVKVDQETYEFNGQGERNIIGDIKLPREFQKILVTCTYVSADEPQKPSKLNFGGPYTIGRRNLIYIVAENGDDADFNDAVIELTGSSQN